VRLTADTVVDNCEDEDEEEGEDEEEEPTRGRARRLSQKEEQRRKSIDCLAGLKDVTLAGPTGDLIHHLSLARDRV
jgi:hypothetical protein